MYQPAFLGPRAVSRFRKVRPPNENQSAAAGQGRDTDGQEIRRGPIPSHPILRHTIRASRPACAARMTTGCCYAAVRGAGPANPPARLPASPKTDRHTSIHPALDRPSTGGYHITSPTCVLSYSTHRAVPDSPPRESQPGWLFHSMSCPSIHRSPSSHPSL